MDLAHLRSDATPRSGSARFATAPFVPIAICAAVAGIVLGVEALAGLRGDRLLVGPISIGLLGLVQAAIRWNSRRLLRAEADAWILRGYENRTTSRYGWRVAELTTSRERRLLGSSLRAVVKEVSQQRPPGVVPLNRVALRPHRAELVALADRLEALERPVSASGILGVRRLLTEPGSPLYRSTGLDDVPIDAGALFGAILVHLEVRS